MLVDDSSLFRSGLAQLLIAEGHDVVAELADGPRAVAVVGRTSPDVVVMDIRMPPTWTTEGLQAAVQVRQDHPSVGVLVLSQYVETTHALNLLTQSPSRVGYLLKDRVSSIAQIDSALRQLGAGGTVIDSEVVGVLLAHEGRNGRLSRLSDRELDVLALIAEGRSNTAIAADLFLSLRTVETHVTSIFTKLDLGDSDLANRRVLAVLAYLRG
jgi:DNA-binding NarL/FixJ family response regulator